MRPEDRAGVRAQRASVVVEPGAVRGSHLDEPGPGLGDDLRDPEAAPDLDELAAGDDDLASGTGERRGRQQGRGGAVVDRERRLRARELAQQAGDVVLARGARPGGQVELEVRVALGGAREHLAGRSRQRRAADVGVHDHAGCAQDPAQRGLEARPCPRHEVDLVSGAGEELLAPGVELGSGDDRCQTVDGGKGTQALDDLLGRLGWRGRAGLGPGRGCSWGRIGHTAFSGATKESNLPTVGLPRLAGFEGQSGHRPPGRSHGCYL